jgi:hypothetical protein
MNGTGIQPMHAVEWILLILGGYLGCGLVFAVVFFLFDGPSRMDPAARGAGPAFRLVLVPGCAVFWPWLLRRWLLRLPPPEERSRHRRPPDRRNA